MKVTSLFRAALALGCLILPAAAAADDEFDQEPINYRTATADNVVADLIERVEAGTAKLKYDDRLGYLRSLLKELKVPESSQMLVFTKTSLQRRRIAPRTPRAIYFSDEVYVGYCQRGDVLELSAVDPQLGAVFYTLAQQEGDKPRFTRQNDNCTSCHAGTATRGVPGHVVRSVFSDEDGFPILSGGSHRVDHTTPFEKRWGGWYVTGTHGDQTHLGNLVIEGNEVREPVDNSAGLNLKELGHRVSPAWYPTPHSDLVALMVLEHQAEGHNLITRANFLTRQALHYEATLNKELGKPAGERWESTTSRIKSAGEPLVRYLLMSGEAPLTAKVEGTSGFATEFAQAGPRDGKGRSLRDLDLERRLFKHPCSYLVYSAAFDAMPEPVKEYVGRRIGEVLSGKDTSKEFAHLTAADRSAVREILAETKPGLLD